MFKKVIVIICVSGLIQLVITACCPEPKTYYNRITNLEIANCNLKTELSDSTVFEQNNFRIRLTLLEETFAQIFNPFPSLFISSAYATTCPESYVGLKSDIIEFTITCNQEILNTAANEPIDYNKLNVYKSGFFDDSKNFRMSISEWLEIMNNGGYQLAFEWYFEFKESINSDNFLKFKIKMKQEDGTEFEVETNTIKIE